MIDDNNTKLEHFEIKINRVATKLYILAIVKNFGALSMIAFQRYIYH